MNYIALVGNLSEGYRAVGPFDSFSEAAWATDGMESWILSLEPIEQVKEQG